MIDGIEFRSFIDERMEIFRIATGTSTVAENVIVKVVSGDEFGVGNASPNRVTEDTVDSVERFLARAGKSLIGKDEEDIAGIHSIMDGLSPKDHAAKAAIDIALYDLLSRRANKPLHEYLGSAGRDRILTDMTIGIESLEGTVQRALKHVKDGFRALKIKVGLDFEEDIRRVEAVRDAVGPKILLRLDANQGYTVEQAIDFSERMHSLDVQVIEQPVRAEDLEGLRKVTKKSEVPIMADECVKSVGDAKRIVDMGAAHMINIKLMKSEGIFLALEIDRLARSKDIGTMVGCMGEIQVSIAAGLHFALGSDNVRFADLDSHFSISTDASKGLVFEDGYLVAPKRPGLGVTTPLDGVTLRARAGAKQSS